jgi:hypothetical protein
MFTMIIRINYHGYSNYYFLRFSHLLSILLSKHRSTLQRYNIANKLYNKN